MDELFNDSLPQDAFQVGDFYYQIIDDDHHVSVCRLANEEIAEVHIPAQIEYNGQVYHVTEVDSEAFDSCYNVIAITFPEGITRIQCGSFSDTVNLAHVSLPSSLRVIEEFGFSHCDLESIVIPEGVTTIKGGAFFDCVELKSVVIPEGVTTIDAGAFDDCIELKSINIPGSIVTLSGGFFCDFKNLTSVTISEGLESIEEGAFYGCKHLPSIAIPNSVTSIGEEVFNYCYDLHSIVVESGNPVYDSRNNCNAIIETASGKLIAGCKATIIPDGVTSIADYAFAGCRALSSIVIPNTVTSIGKEAFKDCTSLISITIPKSVTHIGENAFAKHIQVIRKE